MLSRESDFLEPDNFSELLKKIKDDGKIELFYLLDKFINDDGENDLRNLYLTNDFINLQQNKYSEFNSTYSYEKLPIFLWEIDSLTSLNFSSACQISPPKNLSNLSNLTFLNLANCKIDDFDFLKSIHNLTFLNITNTSLRHIPEVFRGLQKLKILNLSNNPNILEDEGLITYQKIQNCDDLKFLSIRNNALEIMPPAVLQLKEIEAIDCRENLIYEYDGLHKLTNLQGFYHDHMRDSRQLSKFFGVIKNINLIKSSLFLMHYGPTYGIPLSFQGQSSITLDSAGFAKRIQEVES
ncbi:MAG: leucine-rich repeat domain-containing protein, partial [Rickettsiales bacterium]